jgi:D-alanine-D-alanine ligase-like ATP-grasp enzyme
MKEAQVTEKQTLSPAKAEALEKAHEALRARGVALVGKKITVRTLSRDRLGVWIL